MVKVVRRGGRNTRVILSNGRNDLVPSTVDGFKNVEEGDKVVLCPYPDESWTRDKDAVTMSLRRMKKEGKFPQQAIDNMNAGWAKFCKGLRDNNDEDADLFSEDKPPIDFSRL